MAITKSIEIEQIEFEVTFYIREDEIYITEILFNNMNITEVLMIQDHSLRLFTEKLGEEYTKSINQRLDDIGFYTSSREIYRDYVRNLAM